MASALEIRWARVFWAALLVALANFWLLVAGCGAGRELLVVGSTICVRLKNSTQSAF
jgi:hypothetical protein